MTWPTAQELAEVIYLTSALLGGLVVCCWLTWPLRRRQKPEVTVAELVWAGDDELGGPGHRPGVLPRGERDQVQEAVVVEHLAPIFTRRYGR